jgi:hypothetical protein
MQKSSPKRTSLNRLASGLELVSIITGWLIRPA